MSRAEPKQLQAVASATPPHREAYDAGLQQGQRAAEELGATSPLDAHQREWLRGFLAGLFGSAPRPPDSAEAVASDPRAMTRSALAHAPPPGSGRFHRENPFVARIEQVERRRHGEDELILLELDLGSSGLDPAPGDRLGVAPQNDADEVRKLLRVLGVRGATIVSSRFGRAPLWQLLLERVEIGRVTTALVELLAATARSRDEERALAALLESAQPPDHSVQSLLRRFPSARPTASAVLATLDPLAHAAYPIATRGSRCVALARAGSASATADGLGGARDFELSAFLAARAKVGEWVPVYVDRRPLPLPEDDTTPVIFLAEGPACACLQALLESWCEAPRRGRAWMVADGDALGAELDELARACRRVRLDLGDGRGADSVSELLLREQATLRAWLVDHSRLYVLGGDALQSQVRARLTEHLMVAERLSAEQAAVALEDWTSSGRLVTWGP